MKLSFKILGAAAVLAAVACTLPSCSSELSLEEDSFDTTVNFGGEAFSIPVGSTDEIAIGDFLEISEGDVIGIDNNGNYYIGFSQTFEQKISVSDFTDKLTVAGLYHVMRVGVRAQADQVFVSDPVLDYIIRLVNATRSHPMIVQGASPRASLALTAMAKAAALVFGRDFVNPEDVTMVFSDVVTHRLILSPRAEATGNFQPAAEILRQVPPPKIG